MFYVKCSNFQENPTVFATNSFCRKGLSWGENKLKKAKAFLKSENLIETIVKRGANGRIIHHHVRIGFNQWVISPPDGENHSVENETEKKIRDKKQERIIREEKEIENLFPNGNKVATLPDYILEVLDYWNSTFKNINNITKHGSIFVQATVYKKGKKFKSESIIDTLQRVTTAGFTPDQIKIAITNYYKVILRDESQMFWKTLGNFLYAGVVNGNGFIKFLSDDSIELFHVDPFRSIREKFKPTTLKYDEHNIFNKNEYTYYGVSVNKLTDEKDMLETIGDIRSYTRRGNFTYGCLNYIEIAIASLLYTRKKHPQLELINEMMGHWNKLKVLGEKKI